MGAGRMLGAGSLHGFARGDAERVGCQGSAGSIKGESKCTRAARKLSTARPGGSKARRAPAHSGAAAGSLADARKRPLRVDRSRQSKG
jgi:hypothetical protein